MRCGIPQELEHRPDTNRIALEVCARAEREENTHDETLVSQSPLSISICFSSDRAIYSCLSCRFLTANCILIAQFPIENQSEQGRFAELPLEIIGKVQILGDYYAIRST